MTTFTNFNDEIKENFADLKNYNDFDFNVSNYDKKINSNRLNDKKLF